MCGSPAALRRTVRLQGDCQCRKGPREGHIPSVQGACTEACSKDGKGGQACSSIAKPTLHMHGYSARVLDKGTAQVSAFIEYHIFDSLKNSLDSSTPLCGGQVQIPMRPRRDINNVVWRVLYHRGCDSVAVVLVEFILAYYVTERTYASEIRRVAS